MDFEGAFGPDEIIGLSDFLVDGELGLKALLDLVRGPAAGKEALALGGSGAGDANGSVEFLFGVSFEKERNDYDSNGAACASASHDGSCHVYLLYFRIE